MSLASASALELELLVELLGVGLVMSIHESTLSSGLDRGLRGGELIILDTIVRIKLFYVICNVKARGRSKLCGGL